MMLGKKFRIILLLLGIGLGASLWSCAPMAAQPTEEEPTGEEPAQKPTATLDLPSLPLAPTALPRLPETRRLTFEFPPKIRAGDSDVVRLTLEVDDLGNITPTAELENGNVITGEIVEIPNLYETHTVIAEARLDMAGMQVIPGDLVSEPLLPGQSVSFYWSLRPDEPGEYRGTAWLYLRFIPKDGGAELRRTLSAQVFNISAVTLWGFKAGPARIFGGIGSVISVILGLPLMDDLLKYLWERIKPA